MIYRELYKITFSHVKTTTLYFIHLSKSYIVMKYSIKLVSHWVMHSGDGNGKYHKR